MEKDITFIPFVRRAIDDYKRHVDDPDGDENYNEDGDENYRGILAKCIELKDPRFRRVYSELPKTEEKVEKSLQEAIQLYEGASDGEKAMMSKYGISDENFSILHLYKSEDENGEYLYDYETDDEVKKFEPFLNKGELMFCLYLHKKYPRGKHLYFTLEVLHKIIRGNI